MFLFNHSVYIIYTQRSTRQHNNNLGLLLHTRTHPHTPTHTHTHTHPPTHPPPPYPPSLHPHPQPPNLPPPTPSSFTSPPPHIILHYLPAMNTKSMDVLLIQRVRGISRGIGRKPTAGTEISRSAAPKAGRVTTTRALGFGCHSVSQRSLHVQPKGRITYEDGGNPNTGTHEMKTHTHTETRHSIFAIPHMMFVVYLICLTDCNETRQSHKRGSRQGSLQPTLLIYTYFYIMDRMLWRGCGCRSVPRCGSHSPFLITLRLPLTCLYLSAPHSPLF